MVPFKPWERHWPEDVVEQIFSKIPLRDLPKVCALSKKWKSKFGCLAAQQWQLYCPVLLTFPLKDDDPYLIKPIKSGTSSLVAFNGMTKERDGVPVHPSVFPTSRLICFVRIWGLMMVQVYSNVPETDASESPLGDERIHLVHKFTGQSVVPVDERVRLVNIFTGQSVELPVIHGLQDRLCPIWGKTGFRDETYFWNVNVEGKIISFIYIMKILDVLFFSTSEGFRVILIIFLIEKRSSGRLLMYEFQSCTGIWKQRATTAHLDSYPTSQSTLIKDENLYMIGEYPFGIWKYPLHQDDSETERLKEFEYESKLELPRVSYESTRSLNNLMEASFKGNKVYQRFVGLFCMDEKLMAVALGVVYEKDSELASWRMKTCVYDVDEKTLDFTIVSCVTEDLYELPSVDIDSREANYDFNYRISSDDKTIFLWPYNKEANDVLTYNVAEMKWSCFPLCYLPHEKKEHQGPFQWRSVGGSTSCPNIGNFLLDSLMRKWKFSLATPISNVIEQL